MQLPVPEHPPPDQLANVAPPPAIALTVTIDVAAKGAAQVVPQLMPAGDEVTVPAPVPALFTVSVKVAGLGVTLFDAAEAAPVANAFAAVTLNVYAVPFESPVTMIGDDEPEALMAPGVEVAV